MGDISIRPMQYSDIEQAMRLKEAESWNQTELDWRFFLDSDPDLCLVASLEREVVGTVTAIKYHNEISWIGMMLVSRDHRNQGIGKRLLASIIERLGDRGSIKLDATPAGIPVYQKLGFAKELALCRMTAESIRAKLRLDRNLETRRIEKSDIVEIAYLDKRAFGSDRTELIEHLVEHSPFPSRLARRNGEISGFILGRPGTRFIHLGPIVARSIADAKAILTETLVDLVGKPTVIDIPAHETKWQNWLGELGFSQQRSLTRMYLGKNLFGENAGFQFAICGPELG